MEYNAQEASDIADQVQLSGFIDLKTRDQFCKKFNFRYFRDITTLNIPTFECIECHEVTEKPNKHLCERYRRIKHE